MSAGRRFALSLLALLVMGAGARLVPASQAEPEPASAGQSVLTIAEYRAELQRLLASVTDPHANRSSVAVLAETVPPSWQVLGDGQQFRVSNQRLGADLLRLSKDERVRADIEARLKILLADIEAYARTPPDHARDRQRLAEILDRAEFSRVHGPTWFDELRQRAAEMVLSVLVSLIGPSSFPVVARTLVYVILGLALLVTGSWVLRTLRSGHIPVVVPSDVPVSAREWTVWMAEAREAAARSDWRSAVHLAYWAAISCMESRRLWPPDRARTPREYVRMLPAASEEGPALSALTRLFEPVWYGYRAADPETFEQTIAAVEKLGCRSS